MVFIVFDQTKTWDNPCKPFRDTGEKGRDLTQSYNKSPYIHRKTQKATCQHKNATKNVDYITIADRLKTVSWGNDSHPTGVVKPVYAIPTLAAHLCRAVVFELTTCRRSFYCKPRPRTTFQSNVRQGV